MITRGSCLCGAVRYTVTGPLRDVVACHCTQCRKQSGHFFAATSAPREAITVEGAENVTWYDSSSGIRRGFCKTCGSHLFWDSGISPTMTFLAGSIDGATGLKIAGHIFCADKGDYYEIDDGLEQHDAYPPEPGGTA